MSEESFNPDMNIDTGGSGEAGSEVSPEDLIRVQENIGNARKVAGQKAKSQRSNKQFALMLSFIFKYVEDERFLSYVYELMTNFKIDTITIFGHFLPILKEYMDIEPYKPLYGDVWDNIQKRSGNLTGIGTYFTKYYATFPQLKNIPDSLFIDMVMKYFERYGLLKNLKEEEINEIRSSILSEMSATD